MASTCPIDLDVEGLRSEVQTMYSRVAAAPEGEFHFHRRSVPAPQPTSSTTWPSGMRPMACGLPTPAKDDVTVEGSAASSVAS